MNTLEQAGLALLMAEEGKAQFARSLATAVKGWISAVREWLEAMPTTLPPTESNHR